MTDTSVEDQIAAAEAAEAAAEGGIVPPAGGPSDVPADVAGSVPAPVDYFNASEEYSVTLPDGVQTVTCKSFNEGMRKKYQMAGNKEVRIHRASKDAFFKIGTAEEREALLKEAIVGWTLQSARTPGAALEPKPFNPGALADFLKKAPPQIIDHIEKEVRKHETWLMDDMTVEDIDKQIEELQELRTEVEAREEGKDS